MAAQDNHFLETPQLLEIGCITSIHGLKGAVVVSTDSGKESALGYLETVYLGEKDSDVVPHKIAEADWMPRGWKVTFEQIQSVESAETLRGKKVWANRADLEESEDNTFYLTDLVGCKILEHETERELGELTHIEFAEGQGQDRWWAKGPDGEYSIPAHARFIRRVDAKNQKIWISCYAELKP